LYQGVYKAVIVNSDEQLLSLSRYLHRQALASQGEALRSYQNQPSSYQDYLEKRSTDWLKPEEILSFFSKTNPQLSYQNFIEDEEEDTCLNEVVIID